MPGFVPQVDTLIDPDIAWEVVDATTARARFTYEGQAIAATLLFASTGELVNFQSDDLVDITYNDR